MSGHELRAYATDTHYSLWLWYWRTCEPGWQPDLLSGVWNTVRGEDTRIPEWQGDPQLLSRHTDTSWPIMIVT